MIINLIPWSEIFVCAMYEAQKNDLGTVEDPIDNIDVLKYIELLKKYYQEIYKTRFLINNEVITFLNNSLNFSTNQELIPIHEQEKHINNQLFQEVFVLVNHDFQEYLNVKYKGMGQILYLEDYRKNNKN